MNPSCGRRCPLPYLSGLFPVPKPPRALPGCCCAARDKLPFTKTKYTKTKTEVHYKTVTSTPKKIGKRSLGDGSSGPFSPASASETEINMPSSAFSPPKDSSESLVSSLFARHVCPRCPIGAKMGKNNGGAKYYCCPARKTVTKSAVLTLRSTRTITKAPVSNFSKRFLARFLSEARV